jgi:hypothetical protein
MTNATFNDLSKDGQEVIRYDKAYQVTVVSKGNKTELSFDTKLDQKIGTLQEMIQLALQNGINWNKITWEEDPVTKKKKKVITQVLDDTGKA